MVACWVWRSESCWVVEMVSAMDTVWDQVMVESWAGRWGRMQAVLMDDD